MNKSKNSRGKTDTSLTGERSKTDELIQDKSEKVDETINQKISDIRLKTDSEKIKARKNLDKKKVDSRVGANPEANSKLLIEDKDLEKERLRVDLAHKAERLNEDKLRASERKQKEQISETFLKSERDETDSNLKDERNLADQDSKRSSENLTTQTDLAILSKSHLDVRDKFLAVLSHDLRSPLSSIIMATQIMKENIDSGDLESQREMIELIDRNTKNMDRMITELLDVERMTNGKLELNLKEIDLRDLLKECKTLLQPLVKSKGLNLVLELPKSKVMARVDHDKIIQVMSNLIGNALKFAPSGDIRLKLESGQVKISVCDSGPGISKEDQDKLFNKFSQLDSKDRSGLGLGLFICKWIVEAHGGIISVESDLGAGCTFSFTLEERPRYK